MGRLGTELFVTAAAFGRKCAGLSLAFDASLAEVVGAEFFASQAGRVGLLVVGGFGEATELPPALAADEAAMSVEVG